MGLHFLTPSPSTVCVSDGFGGEAVGTMGHLELTGSDSPQSSWFGYRVDTEREVLALVGAVWAVVSLRRGL